MFQFLFYVLAGAIGTASMPAQVIEEFSQPDSLAPWTFYNGAEYPGATGSLTLSEGHSGPGARLAYDLSQGGNYTAANYTLPTPVTAAAISFWVKSPSNALVTLQVVDSTNQVLQYSLPRPVGAMDANAWYQQIVALDGPAEWYFGANDGILHNPIKGLSIVAVNRVESHPVGAIDFDDIRALGSTDFTLDPTLPLIPAPTGSEDLLAQMGVSIHLPIDDRGLDAAQAAGFSWIRTDLFWSAVETVPNVYNWAVYDQLVSALASRGMKAFFILDYGNPIHTGSSDWMAPPITPSAITAFGNFAQAAAAHFAGKGVRFEVWPEANHPVYWPPTPNPAQYAALAKDAIARVHAGDPNALVSTTGLSNFDYDFARGYLALGGGIGANAIGIHPYEVTHENPRKGPPGRLTDCLIRLQQVVAQYLPNPPPIWDTEWGVTSTDYATPGTSNGHEPGARQRQATMAVRRLLSGCAVGLPLYMYYDLRDDGLDQTDREHNFGLLANDYSDKPAMTAVKQLAAVARGRRFSGIVRTSPSSLTGMRFDGPRDSVVALWSDAPKSTVVVTVAGDASVTDVLGASVTLLNGTFILSEAAGPVYISFAHTLAAKADFNGDGKSDIFWSNTTTGERAVWFMNGSTAASGAVISTVPTVWTISATGDYNGDGKADSLLTNSSTGDRAMWLMNGSTVVTNAFLTTVPLDWTPSGNGDFNGDGKADILWSNTITGDRAIWLMNGSTMLAGSGYLTMLPVAWKVGGTADFNGDGKADILWNNTVTGERAIWFMNGSAATSGASLGTVPVVWAVSAVSDFNGDGKADILFSNTTTGDRAMWLMNGGAIVTNAFVSTVPLVWSVSGTGDYNGDGKADILWTNTVSGDRSVWLMNGPVSTGGGYLGTLPVAWEISSRP